jgi:hypothetical protein
VAERLSARRPTLPLLGCAYGSTSAADVKSGVPPADVTLARDGRLPGCGCESMAIHGPTDAALAAPSSDNARDLQGELVRSLLPLDTLSWDVDDLRLRSPPGRRWCASAARSSARAGRPTAPLSSGSERRHGRAAPGCSRAANPP